ncbi:hypothetical protein [Aeromonas salmonicida]
MSLTLDDKQLLRSLSLMMVKDPKFARQLFIKFRDRESSNSFTKSGPIDKIDSIIEIVINYDDDYDYENYLMELKNEIGKLRDKDVREILYSSLQSS